MFFMTEEIQQPDSGAARGGLLQGVRKLFFAQPVLVIAFLAALISVCIVPPDREYLGYCNRAVLIQLFGLMTAVAGVRGAGVFDLFTAAMLRRAGTVRRLGLMLMLLCFFTSMLVTNDVVLLTFVPLTILIFREIPDETSRIRTIVLETAAANLGSMLTPVGNPQNLYLYAKYELTAGTFLKTLLPAGILSLAMLTLLCMLLLPASPCKPAAQQRVTVKKPAALAFFVLFGICLCSVFRLISDLYILPAALVIALLADRKALAKADYALLATFVCFFVFVGNIARIEAVSGAVSAMLSGHELLLSAALSQVISNVPAAVMLAGFTGEGTALLLGVNIGGLGTLIASLASLISFQFYRKSPGADTGRYFRTFTAVGFGMLAVLLGFSLLI